MVSTYCFLSEVRNVLLGLLGYRSDLILCQESMGEILGVVKDNCSEQRSIETLKTTMSLILRPCHTLENLLCSFQTFSYVL